MIRGFRHFSRWFFSGLGGVAGLCAAPEPARSWLPAAGEWHEAAHWTPAGLPALPEEVWVDGTRSVEISTGPATAGMVRVGVTAGSEARLRVGRNAALTTRIPARQGDTDEAPAMVIGDQPGARGEVAIEGENHNEGSIFAGMWGHGSLRVEAGGSVRLFLLILASQPGSSADVELSGRLECDNAFGVGDGGRATLRIARGGLMRYQSRWGVIASKSSSVGQLEVWGELEGAAESDLMVGNVGRGTLVVHPEGRVSGRRGWIASHAPGWGRATVTGHWQLTEELSVGRDGAGELAIEPGGRVTSGLGQVGFNSMATGRAWVGGTWDCAGEMLVGARGSGSLELGAQGILRTGAGIVAGEPDQSGVVLVAGEWENRGNLTIGAEGNGRVEIAAGGKTRVAGDVFIGTLAGSAGRLAVAGTWRSGGDLNVGYASTGRLEIAEGGLVTGVDAHLGRAHTAHGVVSVAGTLDLAGKLDLAGEGRAGLTVESTGRLHCGPAVLAAAAGAEAHVTLRGFWRAQEIAIGNAGRAGVTVAAGGRLEAAQIGVGAGSALVLAGGTVSAGLEVRGGNVSLQGTSRLEFVASGAIPPVRFLAGSALVAGPGARLELAVAGENFAPGTHRLISFAADAARESVSAETFLLGGAMPADLHGRLKFSPDGLDLVVERR